MRVLFTTNCSLGSRLIRWVTGETVSHVAISWSDITYHSSMLGGGVNLVWTDTFLEHNTVVAEVPWTPDGSLRTRLRTVANEGYDWVLLVTLGLRRLGLPVPLADNPYRDICTELVTEHLLGIPDKLTPGQLLARLKEQHP